MAGDLYGFQAMITAMRAQIDAIRDATPDAITEAAHFLEGTTKVTLTTTSHPRGTPTPSRPGEPPSLITGALRGSVKVGELEGEGDRWSVKVGATTVYARIQELGGICGAGYRTILLPRPYLAPSMERARDRLGEIVREHWADALRAS